MEYINNVNEIIGFHLTSEPHGCFSNWFRSEFVYAGIEYNCVEQYMMAQKVALGRRYDLYEEIMKTYDPSRMKSLAGKEHYPEFAQIKGAWDKNCRHIVKRGVKAKFLQNLDMMNELLETGDALIAECAGQDRIWGIGINLQNPEWKDISKWNGSNYLGIILMEIRDELRKEQHAHGVVQYIDYRDAGPIKEAEIPIGQLRRIPQYYSAIHAYADQLNMHDRNAFYRCSLELVEDMMRENMGGGLPIAGFYEMKQDIYETARRLSNKYFVSDIFRVKPHQWGLRGAPYFWKTLESEFAFDEIDITVDELNDKIHAIFEQKTNEELTEESVCYVEEYAHGGMSSGHISGEWLIKTCIPMLQKRLLSMQDRLL